MAFMKQKDAIAGSLAEFFITLDGQRYSVIQGIDFEGTFNKTKSKIPILGKTGKGNKTTGWDGTWKCKIHYNTSLFRELLHKYKETGEESYFDIQVTNGDPSSDAGRQTVIYKGCSIDGGILSKFDVNAEYLDEEINGTYEDFEIPEKFNLLNGMV